MIFVCKVCGKDFKRCPAKGKIPKCCSFECRNKSYIRIKSFNCKQCGKLVEGSARKIDKKRKFCSQECVCEWKKKAYTGRQYNEYLNQLCTEDQVS
jgi:hypothetical protein